MSEDTDHTFPLPSWDESAEYVKKGVANPLMVFIHNHEPVGADDEEKFRDDLREAVFFIMNTILGIR